MNCALFPVCVRIYSFMSVSLSCVEGPSLLILASICCRPSDNDLQRQCARLNTGNGSGDSPDISWTKTKNSLTGTLISNNSEWGRRTEARLGSRRSSWGSMLPQTVWWCWVGAYDCRNQVDRKGGSVCGQPELEAWKDLFRFAQSYKRVADSLKCPFLFVFLLLSCVSS